MTGISIVIPSLNQGRFLEQAIESVRSQSHPGIEIIVIDGGSTDESIEILHRMNASLAYWVSEADGGPADALNKGFARASGTILGFLNADDYLLPEALTTVADAFEQSPSADVISGHGYFVTETGRRGAAIYSDRWDARRFRHGACVLVQPATFFRRDAFDRAGGFRRTGRVCWDMELWADLSAAGARFITIDQFLAAFRLHNSSLTGNPRLAERRRSDAREVMSELLGRPERFDDRAAQLWFRSMKFFAHPIRSLEHRFFVRSALKRWKL